jgi:hypothetical protein
MKEISLNASIVCPWRPVELTTDQLVICHGERENPKELVSIVDFEGLSQTSCNTQAELDRWEMVETSWPRSKRIYFCYEQLQSSDFDVLSNIRSLLRYRRF